MGRFTRTGGFAILIAAMIAGCSQPDGTQYREFSENDIPTEEDSTSEVVAASDADSQSESSPLTLEAATAESTTQGDTTNSATGSEAVAVTDTADSPEAGRTDQSANDNANIQPVAASVVTENVDDNVERESPDTDAQQDEPVAVTGRTPKILVEERDFQVEGPQQAIRVSYDDIDLLRVLNMEPVTADAPKLMPGWLKDLDGQRIRIRGFMFPPFQETGIEQFVLARDNQICCFGRSPKIYDVFPVKMRNGVTADYIQNRPFDVVGMFYIRPEAYEDGELFQLYEIVDAVIIDRQRG